MVSPYRNPSRHTNLTPGFLQLPPLRISLGSRLVAAYPQGTDHQSPGQGSRCFRALLGWLQVFWGLGRWGASVGTSQEGRGSRHSSTALQPCQLPHPSPVIGIKMLQHKHLSTSWHRVASLTSVCPGFGFRGTSTLGERASLHHQVLGAEGIACCGERAAVFACRVSPMPRIWPREMQGCLCSAHPQSNWEKYLLWGWRRCPGRAYRPPT